MTINKHYHRVNRKTSIYVDKKLGIVLSQIPKSGISIMQL